MPGNMWHAISEVQIDAHASRQVCSGVPTSATVGRSMVRMQSHLPASAPTLSSRRTNIKTMRPDEDLWIGGAMDDVCTAEYRTCIGLMTHENEKASSECVFHTRYVITAWFQFPLESHRRAELGTYRPEAGVRTARRAADYQRWKKPPTLLRA